MEHSYWEIDCEIYTVLKIKLWLMLVKKKPQNKQLILMLQKCWLLVLFFSCLWCCSLSDLDKPNTGTRYGKD